MELFYGKGACSMAPHILLSEAGAKYQLTTVNLAEGQQKKPPYVEVNPKGSVPALKTDKGEVLTEAALILQYIADQFPEKNLIPKFGGLDRYRAMEWLNYISTEFHKGIGGFFSYNRMTNEQSKKDVTDLVMTKLKWHFGIVDKHFAKNKFVMGAQFTAPDAYLFTVLNWCAGLKIDLTPYPNILGFLEHMKQRPSVQAAMKEEGLL